MDASLVPIAVALVAGFFLTISTCVGIIGAILLQRRKQPVENAVAVVSLTDQLTDMATKFADLSILHATESMEKTALSRAQVAQSAEQTHNRALDAETIRIQSIANNKLLALLDGMPYRLDQQARQGVQDTTLIGEQDAALDKAGVAEKDRPTELPRVEVSDLDPVTLLRELADAEDARRKKRKLSSLILPEEGDKEEPIVTIPANTPVILSDDTEVKVAGEK